MKNVVISWESEYREFFQGYNQMRENDKVMVEESLEDLEEFRSFVEQNPHYTLDEIAKNWKSTNYHSTYQLLKAIGWYQKKQYW